MSISPKRAAALKLLAAAGLPANASSPVAGFLWRYQIDLPPAYFRGFWGNLAFRGITFAVIWGMGMWLFYWSRHGYSPSAALATTGIGGLLYGLATAAFYEYTRRKYGLPLWRDVSPNVGGSEKKVRRGALPPRPPLGPRGPKPR